jgi:tetratricopeptide (TPR) repeat protein
VFEFFGGKDPQKALQRAREYVREGKTNAAIKVLEDNLTESEEAFDAYLELGRLYYEVDQRNQAVELFHDIQRIVPSRNDEVIAAVSELFYRHTSIDAGDLLIQTYVAGQQFEEIAKILRAFNDRELKLLVTRYEKMKHASEGKNILAKRDVEHILTLGTIYFFLQESKKAVEILEPVIGVESFNAQSMAWARTTVRERYNDPYASFILLKVLLGHRAFEEGLNLAHRIQEKFPDFIDPMIELFTEAKPSKDFEERYAQLMTELHIKKGDLDASIEGLNRVLKKDPGKVDDVAKALRELEKLYPKNMKIMNALSDAYLNAGRVSLALNEFEKILESSPERYDEIVQKYKVAFQKEPNNPLVIQALVNIYLKENDIKSAVGVIESAYQNDPGLLDEYVLNLNTILDQDLDNPPALYLLAVCLGQKGDIENAQVILENLMEGGHYHLAEKAASAILEAKADDLPLTNLRARNLAMMDKEAEAYAILEPFLSRPKEEVIILLPTLDEIVNRKPDLGKKILAFYDRHRKDEPFVFDLATARLYAFQGDYDQSVKIFEKCFALPENKDTTKRALIEVIKARPKAVPLLLSAARLFMKEGDVEIATQFFKTAQSVDPKAFFEIIDEFYDTLKAFPKDREVRVLLIDTFFNRRIWDRVIEEAKKGIEVFGQEAQFFNLKLGQALVESGNLTDGVRPLMLSLEGDQDYAGEVIKYLDKILQIDKSNVPAHFARGRALAKARRIDEAVDEYLTTARILPARAEYVFEELKTLAVKALANPRIMFALGNIEIILKKFEDGIKHLLQACELDPTFVKQIIPTFEKLIAQMPTPLLQFSLARIYHLANIKGSAVKYYIAAQAADKIYREPAISEMKQICAEDPKDAESRRGLAQIFLDYNDLEDALDLTAEIYKMNPGEGEWVKSFIPRILEKNPKHIQSYYLLLYIFLNEGEYRKAIEVAQRLVDIAPQETPRVSEELVGHLDNSPDVVLYLATLNQRTGDLRNAVRLLDKLFLMEPARSPALMEQLQAAIKKDPGYGESYLLAARVYAFQKQYPQALSALAKAEKIMPERGEEISLRAAQVNYDMGEAGRALEIYRQLLAKTKDRKVIYRLIKKTKADYLKRKIETIKGEDEGSRLDRAAVYLMMDQLPETEKELKFVPKDPALAKRHTLLRARYHLMSNRPLKALEIMKNLTVDDETAPVYVEIYDATGSYEAAASVLRKAGMVGTEKQIEHYRKLAQERRLTKGKYFIEGRI